jgi:phosphoserine aminotransferase
VTSNETIHGVAFEHQPGAPFPKADAPLVCDASSDIFGVERDMKRFALVYGGAQKNVGPSGVTLVIVRKDLLEKSRKDLPTIFQLRVHAENRSLYNTPPTFGIYLVRNVLDWVKAEGGVKGMEARNRRKAASVYDAIDASGGFYKCPVSAESRSIMNVVFRLPTPALEDAFVKDAEKQKMIGLKGHRSVGGIRASLYNAVEPEWASALGDFMKDFAKRNG